MSRKRSWNGYQAVVLHRIAHWFKSRGIPVLGPPVARFMNAIVAQNIPDGSRVLCTSGIEVSTP